ncbi:hypothetical protein EYF80_015373 [Liparis tanakae]|uniref:Uncharacterized protein n=1 Tax=Liparis tanakae TaxID=230148 RepID=A0A4Z2IAT6_9TELE|nr:hypothetical protein EYF80_015373 [Liparis tanakae]
MSVRSATRRGIDPRETASLRRGAAPFSRCTPLRGASETTAGGSGLLAGELTVDARFDGGGRQHGMKGKVAGWNDASIVGILQLAVGPVSEAACEQQPISSSCSSPSVSTAAASRML